jgi:hypothetical protein
MVQTWVQEAAALASAMGLGGLLKAGFDAWRAKIVGRAKEPAALITSNAEFAAALSDAAKKLLEDYRNQLTFVRGRCNELEEKVDACEGRHADCEGKIRDFEHRLDESERDRLSLQLRIDRLMEEHPPADYGPTLIRGVVPPTKA